MRETYRWIREECRYGLGRTLFSDLEVFAIIDACLEIQNAMNRDETMEAAL
jgi:hypothetical protein